MTDATWLYDMTHETITHLVPIAKNQPTKISQHSVE